MTPSPKEQDKTVKIKAANMDITPQTGNNSEKIGNAGKTQHQDYRAARREKQRPVRVGERQSRVRCGGHDSKATRAT